MEQVKTITPERLRNDEAYGFHATVIDGIMYLPKDPTEGVAPLKAKREAYSTAFNEFDLIYKQKESLNEVVETDEADAAATEAWSAAYAYVKVMMRAPDETMQTAASTLMEEFEKNGNPTKLSQLERLSILQNLVNDLNEHDLDTINGCSFNMWLENLEEATSILQDKITRRSEAAGRRKKGKIQEAREKLDQAYREFADRINVVAAYEESDEYDTFIRFLNALIDRQQAIIKTRTTKNGNKDDEKEDKPILPEEPEDPETPQEEENPKPTDPETPQEPDEDDDKFPDGGDFEEIPVEKGK